MNKIVKGGSFLLILASAMMLVGFIGVMPEVAQGEVPAHLRGYEGTEISIFGHFAGQTTVMFDELIPEFEKLTGMKVVRMRTGVDEYPAKLIAELAAHSGAYDVFQDSPDVLFATAVENQWIVPVEKYLLDPKIADPNYGYPEDFVPALLEIIGKHNGTLWELPWRSDARFLFYRTDLFDEAGFAPPKTWEEELEIAKYFVKPPDLYGIVHHGRQYVGTAYLGLELLWSVGGHLFDENMKPVFNSLAGVKGLEHFSDMIKYAPPDILTYGFMEFTTAFCEGRSAMARSWSGLAGVAAHPESSKILGKWNATIIPHLYGYKTVANAGGWGYAINADSKNKEAGYKLIEWLTTAENEKKCIELGGEACPVRFSTFEDPELRKKLKHFAVYPEALACARGVLVIPEINEVLEELALVMTESATGVKTAKEALDDGARRVEKIMERAGYYE